MATALISDQNGTGEDASTIGEHVSGVGDAIDGEQLKEFECAAEREHGENTDEAGPPCRKEERREECQDQIGAEVFDFVEADERQRRGRDDAIDDAIREQAAKDDQEDGDDPQGHEGTANGGLLESPQARRFRGRSGGGDDAADAFDSHGKIIFLFEGSAGICTRVDDLGARGGETAKEENEGLT